MSQLPDGWSYESINSIVKGGMIADGDWVESKDQDPNGQVRLTQLADVGEGEFRSRSDRWMNDEQASRLNVNYLQPGDLLMARMPDPLGRTCMVPENIGRAVTVVDVAIIRITRKDMNPKFVMWLLNSPSIRQQIEMLASGTTRRRITRKNLGTIDLPMPPFEEQNKIVELLEDHLSRLDAALADVKQTKIKAAQFRRSILQAAFSGKLTASGTFSPTSLPEGWTQLPIGNLCKSVNKIDPSNLGRGSFKYVDIGSLEPSSSSLENVEAIPTKGAPGRARQLLAAGDSIFATVRPYMKKVAYISEEFDGEIASTGFCVMRPNEETLDTKFLFYFLLSDDLLDQVLPLQRGVSYPAIRDNDLRNAIIPLPSMTEQRKIVTVLEDNFSRIEASTKIAQDMEKQAAALRRSLLQAAFRGQLTKEVVSV